MNPSKILRIALIAEIALVPVGVAFSFWADGFLPGEVLALEENQKSAIVDFESPVLIVFIVAAVALFCAWMAAVVGLFQQRRWGAWLYLFSTFGALPVYFMTGFDVRHPIDQVFDDVFRFIPGFIIGLAFFSGAIPKKDAPVATAS